MTRFRKDAFTKLFFVNNDDDDHDPKQLFIRSDWEPDSRDIPPDFCGRIRMFLNAFENKFRKWGKVPPNLTPIQRALLNKLCKSSLYVVFPTDKNLGPAILERATYIQRVLQDHLLDESTYQCLSEEEANACINKARKAVEQFITDFVKQLSQEDKKYLERWLGQVEDPFAYFYITVKVHKTPWKMRPIVSLSGSLLYGLGKWADRQLQGICNQLPTFLKSSTQLKQQLAQLDVDLSKAYFFTSDAQSMYTNIDTDHALATISDFLRTSHYCRYIEAEPLIRALEIIMRNNVFKFGDTFWLQKTGTAMGTPPAPMYATLYYGIHELQLLQQTPNAQLPLFKRYIDDIFGVWIPHDDKSDDDAAWSALVESLQYGQLVWDTSKRSRVVNFLDLTITVDPVKRRITTKLYEKPHNLYLYLPPQSAHPPGVLQGLIAGGIQRIFRLTTERVDIEQSVRKFYRRLIVRGHSPSHIRPLFNNAIRNVITQKERQPDDPRVRLFLHLPYNPRDKMSSREIQAFCRRVLFAPPGEPAFCQLTDKDGYYCGFNRLTIAYHRQRNLKNLLFPRKFNSYERPISDHIREMRASQSPQDNLSCVSVEDTTAQE